MENRNRLVVNTSKMLQQTPIALMGAGSSSNASLATPSSESTSFLSALSDADSFVTAPDGSDEQNSNSNESSRNSPDIEMDEPSTDDTTLDDTAGIGGACTSDREGTVTPSTPAPTPTTSGMDQQQKLSKQEIEDIVNETFKRVHTSMLTDRDNEAESAVATEDEDENITVISVSKNGIGKNASGMIEVDASTTGLHQVIAPPSVGITKPSLDEASRAQSPKSGSARDIEAGGEGYHLISPETESNHRRFWWSMAISGSITIGVLVFAGLMIWKLRNRPESGEGFF